MFTSETVTVVTAATGHQNLVKCVQSVQLQTYPGVEHYIVVDGEERLEAVTVALGAARLGARPLRTVVLPQPTGKDNWCGHRIYAATSFLVNSEFVAFLDEDNWLEPTHIESLVVAVRETGSLWAFSLRNIVDEHGDFVARDACESLGNLHHVFDRPGETFVDTNCYLLPREVAVAISAAWYGQTRPPDGRVEPDRLVSSMLFSWFPNACSNKAHTLNYTIGNRPDSVRAEYFHYGNAAMRQRYPDRPPW
jgi:glycosyltransferase involved in cell wall biosynthesis